MACYNSDESRECMSILDTIVAISSAGGVGAIAIVRLSGTQAIEFANEIVSQDLFLQASHTISYGKASNPFTKEAIDEVLVSVFKAPKTYTREDIVEINCHGGMIVTKKIIEVLIGLGARLANPGEFTQRALISGRLDLTQAEAVNELIHAQTDQAATMAIDSISGSVSALLEPLKDDLLEIIANIEVNIDYPEYDDVIQLTSEHIYPKALDWIKQAQQLIELSQKGKIVKEGVKTVILGKPNVGKSSLLNALLKEDKAIVTPIAGTTRDLVEGWIRLQHISLHLIDTAGVHFSEDIVEKIGIERSLQAIESADLIILVLDASSELEESDQRLLKLTKDRKRIVVYNKADIAKSPQGLQISALNKELQPLIDAIEELFMQNLLAIKSPTLQNQRQIGLLQQATTYMQSACEAIELGYEVDLVTIDLTKAYQALTSITAADQQTSVIDEIFKRFCLGK